MNFFSIVLKRWLIFSLLVITLPIVAGTVAYQTLPKEGEPEISAPVAIVVTHFPGASPSEVESLVTTPIEEELSDLKDVEEMRSNSAEGQSIVFSLKKRLSRASRPRRFSRSFPPSAFIAVGVASSCASWSRPVGCRRKSRWVPGWRQRHRPEQ